MRQEVYKQVVLEIGNTHVKVGTIDASSRPLKVISSWSKDSTFITDADWKAPLDDQGYRRVIKDNQLVDLEHLLELIEFVLVNVLDIKKENFEGIQLMLVLPSQLIALQLPLRSKIIRKVYERLGVAGVFLGEVAAMAALGSAHGTALVLDFNQEGIEVAAVSDFSLITPACDYLKRGGNLLQSALETAVASESMSEDSELPRTLLEMPVPEAVAHLLAGELSEDRSEVTVLSSTVPFSWFNSVFDSVFAECDLSSPSLFGCIGSVLNRIDSDRRAIVLNHIIVTGSVSYLPLIIAYLNSALPESTVMAVSDYPAESQPTLLAFLGIPDYYQDLKEYGSDGIAFFGATLAGKYAFADSKTFIPAK